MRKLVLDNDLINSYNVGGGKYANSTSHKESALVAQEEYHLGVNTAKSSYNAARKRNAAVRQSLRRPLQPNQQTPQALRESLPVMSTANKEQKGNSKNITISSVDEIQLFSALSGGGGGGAKLQFGGSSVTGKGGVVSKTKRFYSKHEAPTNAMDENYQQQASAKRTNDFFAGAPPPPPQHRKQATLGTKFIPHHRKITTTSTRLNNFLELNTSTDSVHEGTHTTLTTSNKISGNATLQTAHNFLSSKLQQQYHSSLQENEVPYTDQNTYSRDVSASSRHQQNKKSATLSKEIVVSRGDQLRFSLENEYQTQSRLREEEADDSPTLALQKRSVQRATFIRGNVEAPVSVVQHSQEHSALSKYITKIEREDQIELRIGMQPAQTSKQNGVLISHRQGGANSVRNAAAAAAAVVVTTSKTRTQAQPPSGTQSSALPINTSLNQIFAKQPQSTFQTPQNGKNLRSLSSYTRTARAANKKINFFVPFKQSTIPQGEEIQGTSLRQSVDKVRGSRISAAANASASIGLASFSAKHVSLTPNMRSEINSGQQATAGGGSAYGNQEYTSLPVQAGRFTELPLRFFYYITQVEQAYRPPFPQDYFSVLFREHFVQTCQGLQYGTIAKAQDPEFLEKNKVYLGENKSISKKTIVFDLDETLIHCNEAINFPSDVVLNITFPTGEKVKAGVNVRPFAIDMLRELAEDFEIVVFTASHNCYANRVLDFLDPDSKLVHFRFFRDSCVMTQQGVFVKDLRIFADRNLADMVLIDNAAYSFGFQIDNGIPIIPFYDRKEDDQFKRLLPYLKQLAEEPDVRLFNRQQLRLQVFTDAEGPQRVYERLFLG